MYCEIIAGLRYLAGGCWACEVQRWFHYTQWVTYIITSTVTNLLFCTDAHICVGGNDNKDVLYWIGWSL